MKKQLLLSFGLAATMVIAAVPISWAEDTPPTVTPSTAPVVTPSEAPAVTPSEAPDVTPSEAPAVTPSEAPAVTPSEAPAVTPSEAPAVTTPSPKPGAAYAITYVLRGGVLEPGAPLSHIVGTTTPLGLASRPGWAFGGWYLDSKLTKPVTVLTDFNCTGDIKLYAQWKSKRATRRYTIHFDSTGGSTVAPIRVKRYDVVAKPEDPTRDGYLFEGWYLDQDCRQKFVFYRHPTQDLTLYAGWREAPNTDQMVMTIGETQMYVFGQWKTSDVAPLQVNDRTMLPIRIIAEGLGATVTWNEERQEVTVHRDSNLLIIPIGSAKVWLNGQPFKTDSPAFTSEDRTFLPARLVAEGLGAKVSWNEARQEITITK